MTTKLQKRKDIKVFLYPSIEIGTSNSFLLKKQLVTIFDHQKSFLDGKSSKYAIIPHVTSIPTVSQSNQIIKIILKQNFFKIISDSTVEKGSLQLSGKFKQRDLKLDRIETIKKSSWNTQKLRTKYFVGMQT